MISSWCFVCTRVRMRLSDETWYSFALRMLPLAALYVLPCQCNSRVTYFKIFQSGAESIHGREAWRWSFCSFWLQTSPRLHYLPYPAILIHPHVKNVAVFAKRFKSSSFNSQAHHRKTIHSRVKSGEKPFLKYKFNHQGEERRWVEIIHRTQYRKTIQHDEFSFSCTSHSRTYNHHALQSPRPKFLRISTRGAI